MRKNNEGLTLTSRAVKAKPNGFTLIELLVVVALIGLLTSIGIASYSGIQQRGRDTQRKSDLNQIRTALENYFSNNNQYPKEAEYNAISVHGEWKQGSSVYLRSLPGDPKTGAKYRFVPYKNNSGNTCTESSEVCINYDLIACLENSADGQKDPVGNGLITCSTATYTLKAP